MSTIINNIVYCIDCFELKTVLVEISNKQKQKKQYHQSLPG